MRRKNLILIKVNEILLYSMLFISFISCGAKSPGQSDNERDKSKQKSVFVKPSKLDLSSRKGFITAYKPNKNFVFAPISKDNIFENAFNNLFIFFNANFFQLSAVADNNRRIVQAVLDSAKLTSPFLLDKDGKLLKGSTIEKIVDLNSEYLGIKISFEGINYYFIANKENGDLIELRPHPNETKYSWDPFSKTPQIYDGHLYYYDDGFEGILYKRNFINGTVTQLNNPSQILNINGRTFPNKISGDEEYFRHLQVYNYLHGDDVKKVGFVISENVLAIMGGPSGGRRIMLYSILDNSIPPFDTGMFSIFTSVGGGASQALFYAKDGFLYQIRNSSNFGDEIVRFNMNINTGITSTIVENKGFNIGNGRALCNITNYTISEMNRYILFSNGFYKSFEKSDKTPGLTWFSYNLSDVPGADGTCSNVRNRDHLGTNIPTKRNKSLVSGDYFIWYSEADGHKLKRLKLDGISPIETLYTDTEVDDFRVVGDIIYIIRNGNTFVLKDGSLELVGNIDLLIRDIVAL
jgi:hypothetical protein